MVRRFITVFLLAVSLTACGERPPLRRVFLVTIDTLRADHLGLYGYPRDTSPFLDSLGERGQVFETAYASCSHTAPSHASLFTALHPAQHRVLRNGEELDDAVTTLAEIFRDQGYRTAGFTTVRFLEGLSAGFEELSSEKRFHPAPHVLGKAYEWIARHDAGDKLFVWIHLFDVHQWNRDDQIDGEAVRAIRTESTLAGEALLNYLQREHGTDLSQGPEKILRAVNSYDGQILSTDRALARFFATLESEGLARDALWVVTSDHGEGLGNHDYMGHGKTVYNEQIRVPLVFYFTDERCPARRIPGLVQLVDVAAALAELAGASFDGQVIPPVGRSLLPLLSDPDASWDSRSVFAQRRPADDKRLAEGWLPGDVYALQTARYKVIAQPEGTDEFYDLADDPFEQRNLIADPAAEKQRMLEGLLRRYREMVEQGELLGSGEINPEHIEELKALGYL